MYNFNPQQFEYLWSLFRNFITAKVNVDRENRSDFSGKDSFLMILTVLKNGGHWDFLAGVFG